MKGDDRIGNCLIVRPVRAVLLGDVCGDSQGFPTAREFSSLSPGIGLSNEYTSEN